MKRTFELNGRIFYTMMDMARELGVPRIYPKDFAKYGIKEVDGVTVKKTEPTKVADVKSDTIITNVIKVDTVISIDTLQDYANFLRGKTLNELVSLCKADGLDTCDSISCESIRKMHIIMKLKDKKFPGQKIENRKPTAFRKISFDILKTFADNLNLEYRKSDNDGITRMWITKALVDAGVNPEDLIKKAGVAQ